MCNLPSGKSCHPHFVGRGRVKGPRIKLTNGRTKSGPHLTKRVYTIARLAAGRGDFPISHVTAHFTKILNLVQGKHKHTHTQGERERDGERWREREGMFIR